MENKIKFYIVVNADIKLTPGQMCAQVSHITQLIVDSVLRDSYETFPSSKKALLYAEWIGCPITIVKKASEEELYEFGLMSMCKSYSDDVYDKKTNQKNKYLTVVGFFPGCAPEDLIEKLDLV